ncbi:MAG: hypothetical protein AB7Q17_03375 [Phycisphaerae bacterium]
MESARIATLAAAGAALLQAGGCAITAPDYFTYEILSLVRQLAVNALTYGVLG